MRKTFILFLALLLAACNAAPTQASVPPTAQVVVATVLVPADVTTGGASTTDQSAAPTGAAPAPSGLMALDAKYNGPSFERISISGDKFSLNCQPKEISFDVYSTDVYIVHTDVYFSLRDKHSTALEPWALAGPMQTDGGNHFWMTLKGDQIKADLRKAQGWFDFQFVGSNKLGQTTDNWHSEKITDLVSYSTNCP